MSKKLIISGLTVLWVTVTTVVLAVLVSILVSGLFALSVVTSWNLLVAPSFHTFQLPLVGVWGLFLVGWVVVQWFKSFITKKES